MAGTVEPGAAPLSSDELSTRLRTGQPLKFAAPSDPLTEPIEAQRARTLPASWFEGLVVEPDRLIGRRIDVEDAIVDGDLRITYATFSGNVRFIGCTFTGAVNLSYSDFKRAAVFDDCEFQGAASFRCIHTAYD